LPLQHDELLAQEGVFQHQFGLAAGQVKSCVQDQGVVVGLCPLAEALVDSLDKSIYTVPDEGKE